MFKTGHTKDPEETALIIEFFLSELENLFLFNKKISKIKISMEFKLTSSCSEVIYHNDYGT